MATKKKTKAPTTSNDAPETTHDPNKSFQSTVDDTLSGGLGRPSEDTGQSTGSSDEGSR